MKKILMLMLHRSPGKGAAKDGGPTFTQGLAKAFSQKGYTLDYLSGNSMDLSKQHENLPQFLQRIHKAADFAKEVDKSIFAQYDLILFLHPSTVFGFEPTDLPLEKVILFPTMLGKEYSKFLEVPKEYIALEKKVLNYSYGHQIHCPSHAQAQLLSEEYNVPKNNIFVQPLGFSPSQFPPLIRTLRQDISPEKPLIILCANVIRPQKGYLELLPFIEQCKERKLPIKVIIYADINHSAHKAYSEYTNKLIEEIGTRGLQDYFKFHAAVSQELLSDEMRNADLALIPSIYESFGQSALESSASGLPTLVFDDVAAYREFLGTDAAVFLTRTPDNFCVTLEKIIKNPVYYHQISIGGIENGKRFYSEEMYKKLVKHILNN